MTREDTVKKGRTYAGLLRGIGILNFLSGAIYGLLILNSFKDVPETMRSIVLIKGISFIIGGIIAMLILLALAYVCEGVAELTQSDQP